MYGIELEQSARPKSELYGKLLRLMNSGRVHLLEHQRLVAQLTALERRTSRASQDSIDHPPNGHDDLANACAGALAYASSLRRQPRLLFFGGVDGRGPEKPSGYYGPCFVGSDAAPVERDNTDPALRNLEIGFVQGIGKYWDQVRDRVLRNSN